MSHPSLERESSRPLRSNGCTESSSFEVQNGNSDKTAEDCSCCISFRRGCWEFLTRSRDSSFGMRFAALAFEIFLCFLAMVLFVMGTFDATTPPADGSEWTSIQVIFFTLETFLTVVFGIEYLLKVFCCIEDESIDPSKEGKYWRTKVRFRKIVEPMMILDLVMIIALGAESQALDGFATFRVFRVFRILSLLRLEHNFRVVGLVMQVMSHRREELGATLMLAVAMLLIVSSAMFYIESPHNPEFTNLWKSMWWGTTALTTVGYGDIYPITIAGRILGCLVAFMGVGMFALPAGILANGFQEVIQARKRTESIQVSESSTLNAVVKQLESQTHELQSDVASMRASQQELHAGQQLLLLEQRRIASLLERLLTDALPARGEAADTI